MQLLIFPFTKHDSILLTTYISMNSNKKLSLAWPHLQLVGDEKDVGFWVLKVKSSAILILKAIFLCLKLNWIILSMQKYKKLTFYYWHIFIIMILYVLYFSNVFPVFELQNQKDPKAYNCFYRCTKLELSLFISKLSEGQTFIWGHANLYAYSY